MTAIQLLEKLGAQKNFTSDNLSPEDFSTVTNLVNEKSQFMAILSNEPAEDEPDDEDEPEKQEIFKSI